MFKELDEHKLWLGDCLDMLKQLPDNSVDSVVTDPPYGISFLSKGWDKGVPSVEIWQEALRVLKPGGHLLAFASTRTQHLMASAIEDAGFEIRDMIAWMYGQGMPSGNLDVSKGIDKYYGEEREKVRIPLSSVGNNAVAGRGKGGEGTDGTRPWIKKAQELGYHETAGNVPVTEAAAQWVGWGTRLKPCMEPLTVARKPLEGSVAHNCLQWGTGAYNIDAARVPLEKAVRGSKALQRTSRKAGNPFDPSGKEEYVKRDVPLKTYKDGGRWPGNVIHDGSQEVNDAFPDSASGGTAARFFYVAKPSRAERFGTDHPTAKPIQLMRYLVKMVTREGGTVVDPFLGSGTTLLACQIDGFTCIGAEREPKYQAIIERRYDRL